MRGRTPRASASAGSLNEAEGMAVMRGKETPTAPPKTPAAAGLPAAAQAAHRAVAG